MNRGDLRLGRLLVVWAPLAATFILVTGSTPVVNAAINRLPLRNHQFDLAAFAVFLSCTVFLHSPLFVTREIAIRLSVDRAGSRRALRFCLTAGVVVSLIEILLGTTQLGAWVLGGFADNPEVVAGAHRAFLFIWPVPLLIAVRGVYQAHQIRVDDTLFVGFGTLVRLGFTAVLGFALAPRIGLSGPVLGSICITIGVGVETIFAVVRARAKARPPEISDGEGIQSLSFGLPLMFANVLGVGASLFYLRIAGIVPDGTQERSLAAFQEVKSIHWLLGAGAFALQSFTTAKVHGPEDARRMLRFGLFVGGGLSLVMALGVFTPLRRVMLVDLLGEKDAAVLALAAPALMVAVLQPLLNAARFSMRGILISRGHTRAITLSNLSTLLILSTAISFGLLPTRANGALNAYLLWTFALLIELLILARLGGGERLLPAPVRSPREASAG